MNRIKTKVDIVYNDNVIAAMDKMMEDTKDNTLGTLNICLNYGGRAEIVDAVNEFKDYIMNEVLAVTLEEDSKADTELKINDYTMNVTIKQIKK